MKTMKNGFTEYEIRTGITLQSGRQRPFDFSVDNNRYLRIDIDGSEEWVTGVFSVADAERLRDYLNLKYPIEQNEA